MQLDNYTEKEFKELVNKFEWVFAKTCTETAPHEYIVLKKVGYQHKTDFIKIA